ncbi:MAG: APC family permease [Anaerovoracaceae bacterium]|nr:APC family permease [Anaerovoracaceae bacterium]
MENALNKRYGLITAITMVVGIVIGSGVFFKAEKILNCTGGDMVIGILSWIIGGLIMVICAYTFSTMATKYEKVNGVVDYAEAMLGKRYGYYLGWFMATMYFPAMTSVLAWVSARYFSVLMGWDITGGSCMVIAGFLLVASYTLNALSPVLAGKFQVTTTVIKMIPLLLMAVFGTVKGLSSGLLIQNFTEVAVPASELGGKGYMLFTAVCATAFAYEGWIIATSINSELKDAKKNLPKALVIGTLIVMITYVLYYIGLAGAVENSVMMESGETGARIAFSNVFSNIGGTLLFVFIVISCLGTLNGLMLGTVRGLYAISVRNEGIRPDVFKQVDPVVNMPGNSAAMGALLTATWLLYFYGANLTDGWFGPFCFDSSELPIIAIYALYIPIFLMIMKKESDWAPFKRFVMPALSICGCIFMVIAAFFSHRMAAVYYLIVFAVVMILAFIIEKKNK